MILAGSSCDVVALSGEDAPSARTVLVRLKLADPSRSIKIVVPTTITASPEYLLAFGASVMAAASEALGLNEDEG
jgi:hypothetical protein